MDKVFRLGAKAVDKGPNEKGHITHMRVDNDGAPWYMFHPYGTDSKTGNRLDGRWLATSALEVSNKDLVDFPLAPMYLINEVVVDGHTGRKGTIRSIVYHVSGCWHAEFQPHERGERGGLARVEDINLDFLEGKLIDRWKNERDAAALAALAAAQQEQKPVPAPRSPGAMDGGPSAHFPGGEDCGHAFR